MTDSFRAWYSDLKLSASVWRMSPISPIERLRLKISLRSSCIWLCESRLPIESMQTYFFTCSPITAFLEGIGYPLDCRLHAEQFPTSTSCLMTIFCIGIGISSSKNTLTDFFFNPPRQSEHSLTG